MRNSNIDSKSKIIKSVNPSRQENQYVNRYNPSNGNRRNTYVPPKEKYLSLRDEYAQCNKTTEPEFNSIVSKTTKQKAQVGNPAAWGVGFILIGILLILISLFIMMNGLPTQGEWVPHFLLYALAGLMVFVGYREYQVSSKVQQRAAKRLIVIIVITLLIGLSIVLMGQKIDS